MGNSTQSQTKSEDVLDNYTFVKSVSQGKKVYKSKITQKQYLTLQRTFPTSQMLILYEGKMRKLLEVTHPYFLNETEHAMITSSTLCSMQYRVVHFFEYQPHTLQEELEVRKKHERYFQEKQIWSILCSSVLAMSHLTKCEVLCYTLHPKDIVIDKLGMIKILSPLLIESGLQVMDEGFYYSPQHLKSLKTSNFSQVSNKSSVFTLGITLLHILSLEPMTELYNYENCTINMELLNQLIDKISQQDIKLVLKKMLKFHSYDRITFTQLEEMLYNVLEAEQDDNQSKHSNENHLHEDTTERFASSIHRLFQSDQQMGEKPSYVSYQTGISCTSIGQRKSQSIISSTHVSRPDAEDCSNVSVYESCVDSQNIDQEDTKQGNHKFQGLESSKFAPNQTSILKDSRTSEVNQFGKTRNALQERYHPNVIASNHPTQKNPLSNSNTFEKNKSYQHKIQSQGQQNNFYSQQTIRPYHIREQLTLGTYEGYKLNNWRHGYGVFYYSQGGKYAGEWFRNKMQGKGALYYANDQIAYEGEWTNDKLHGYGILHNETPTYLNQPIDYKSLHLVDNCWTKYEGNFREDQKYGQGTMFLSNGQYYRGSFKQGLPHGNGIFKSMNGHIFKGTWILGIMQ